MAWRAEQGLWNGGQVLGYDLVDKKLAVNPQEAKLVKTIYTKYLELGSTIQVANWLNRNGYRTKKYTANRTGKKHGGKKFSNNTVAQKLRSRAYLGEVSLKNKLFKGQHEPIIDHDLWEHVNGLLAKQAPTRRNPKQKTQHTFVLQGLLKCGFCGSHLTTKYSTSRNGTRHFYYQCTLNAHNGKEGCEMKYVPAGKLEELVLGKIRSFASDKKLLDEIVLKANESVSDELEELESRKKDHENKLMAVKEKISNFLDAIASKQVKDNKSVGERVDALEELRSQLERTIDTVTYQINDLKRKAYNAEVMHQSLVKFNQICEKSSALELKELLPYFVNYIRFTPQEIKIALYDQPADKGLFVNHSSAGALELVEWLPQVDEFCHWLLTQEPGFSCKFAPSDHQHIYQFGNQF